MSIYINQNLKLPSKNFVDLLKPFIKNRIPSGIDCYNHFKFNDHILLFVETVNNKYLELTLDMVNMSIEEPLFNEFCTLSVSPTLEEKYHEFVDVIKSMSFENPNLYIIPWGETQKTCAKDRKFMREIDLKWIENIRILCQKNQANLIKIISEDCSEYTKWLENPDDYIEWEHHLERDWKKVLGNIPFIQICIYKLDILTKVNKIKTKRIITSLIAAHNVIMYFDGDNIRINEDAIKEISNKYSIKYSIKHRLRKIMKCLV
ncbi:hypothetical protein ES705_38538 [subsurface metagenome]